MAPHTAPDRQALARRYETAAPSEHNYEAICAAVMETARGRWFLAEYAKRNRSADTEMLLAAIAGIEAALADAQPAVEFGRVRDELRALADMIHKARAEFGASGREWIKTVQIMALLEQLQRCVENLARGGDGEGAQPAIEEDATPDAPALPPARAHLTVVAPIEPMAAEPGVPAPHTNRTPMPEVLVFEPLPQRHSASFAAPAQQSRRAVAIGSGTPALSEISGPFTETEFNVPAPTPIVEPEPASSAMLREFEHLPEPAPDQAEEAAFVPFEYELSERPLPQRSATHPKPAEDVKPAATPQPRFTVQPRPPGDPLAPIMALSEEERIALFT